MEGKGTLFAACAGVRGHTVLNPHVTMSAVCACSNTAALAVTFLWWAGAFHGLEWEEPLCTSAQVGCKTAARGDQSYN